MSKTRKGNEFTRYGNVCDILLNRIKQSKNYINIKQESKEIDTQIDKITAALWDELWHGPKDGYIDMRLDFKEFDLYNINSYITHNDKTLEENKAMNAERERKLSDVNPICINCVKKCRAPKEKRLNNTELYHKAAKN
jgi:hypothetical protein